MSDEMHPVRAVRLQSSAVVLAAMITTGGAILSACIQTATTSKPLASIAPQTLAEPIDFQLPSSPELDTLARRNLVSVNSPSRRSTDAIPQVAANEPARLSEINSVAFRAPTAPAAVAHSIEPIQWNVAKPAITMAGTTSTPVVSPWYSLSHSDASSAPQLQHTTKKFDWNSVTKFFSWHN
jgi:hypothetical protein